MKSKNSRLMLVLLLSFILIFNSCSLIGLGIGAVVDEIRPDSKVFKSYGYESFERYEEVTLFFKDNTIRVGKYIEIKENYLTLKTDVGFASYNIDDIYYVEIKLNKNGKRKGFKVGLYLDISVLILLAIVFLNCREPGSCLPN